MRLRVAVSVLLAALLLEDVAPFTASSPFSVGRRQGLRSAIDDITADAVVATELVDLKEIQELPFRKLIRYCKERGLDTTGTMAALRARLRNFGRENEECAIDEFSEEPVGNCDDTQLAEQPLGFEFVDESDPDFDYNELVEEILDKASVGHWKAATRKLKKLKKRYVTPERPVPEHVYLNTLRACMANRLHGARASEPARKIMEEMVEAGLAIPANVANFCIQNCLGDGPGGTHDKCGGIDTALAMLAAVDSSVDGAGKVQEDTVAKLVTSLAVDGAFEDAIAMLRSMVVDRSFTPSLELFAAVAHEAAKREPSVVTSVLGFAKAAGYNLDEVASSESGRSLLASGLVAAEKNDNVALGLRLLAAASKVKDLGEEGDVSGDVLVASLSSPAQRAATLIHKRAIEKAVANDEWQLAVKCLEFMLARKLTPSPYVWRSVVACCAKARKSRKATALLLDWLKLAEAGKAEKPSLVVFNTVVNVCEICDEQVLTVLVLDAMKKAHDTDGNIITFNIALKRLAKMGNVMACEGIIISMLESGVEPTVVTYTTAIAACATQPKDPKYAYEWLRRMRSRGVFPNTMTYNTALAACLDGKLENTVLASKIADEMLAHATHQVEEGIKGNAAYTSALPNLSTKNVAYQLRKQLRENWTNGEIDKKVAKATIRKSLVALTQFRADPADFAVSEGNDVTANIEAELEESALPHKRAEV